MAIVEGKIFGPYQAFYIQSMLFNSQSAIRSIAFVDAILEKLPQEALEEDVRRLPAQAILNELQNIVLQGGALSRYFWPVRRGHEARAAHLRESFGVQEGNALQERNLRNAIEHFDEKLDEYLSSGVFGCIFPEYVGSRPADDGVPGHFFRAFFVDCGVFRLLNWEYQMQPLVAELLRLWEALKSADENGCVLPHA